MDITADLKISCKDFPILKQVLHVSLKKTKKSILVSFYKNIF
jgi:hypothetical protein